MSQSPDLLKYESRNPLKNLLLEKFKGQILNFVNLVKPASILEVGCGEGYLLSFLAKHNTCWRLEGFDIEAEAVEKAKEKVPHAALSIRDIYACGYGDNTFDLVLGTEVLEHLKEPEKALREIRRLTKRWAILSVPNEPFFAFATLGRCKGHCNRWSGKNFLNLVAKYFNIHSVAKPFPWTVVLCEKR